MKNRLLKKIGALCLGVTITTVAGLDGGICHARTLEDKQNFTLEADGEREVEDFNVVDAKGPSNNGKIKIEFKLQSIDNKIVYFPTTKWVFSVGDTVPIYVVELLPEDHCIDMNMYKEVYGGVVIDFYELDGSNTIVCKSKVGIENLKKIPVFELDAPSIDQMQDGRSMTRAEFATIVVKELRLNLESSDSHFEDVKKDAWYTRFVDTALKKGIVAGYGDGKFGTDDKITREQAITMIANTMKIIGMKVELSDSEKEMVLSTFKDTDEISRWAKETVAICVKAGIITGKDNKMLAPKDFVTRAEVSVMVSRLLQKSWQMN
jgi:hypothetical protein